MAIAARVKTTIMTVRGAGELLGKAPQYHFALPVGLTKAVARVGHSIGTILSRGQLDPIRGPIVDWGWRSIRAWWRSNRRCDG